MYTYFGNNNNVHKLKLKKNFCQHCIKNSHKK